MATEGDASCTFCHLVTSGKPSAEYVALLSHDAAGIAEPQHLVVGDFLAVADIAPIVPGHVLLIPTSHVLATAALPGAARTRLDELRRSVGVRLAEQAGLDSYLSFEHGTGKTAAQLARRVKCGPTEHSHLHLMPNHWGAGVLQGIAAAARNDGFRAERYGALDYRPLLAALGHEQSTYHFIATGDGVNEKVLIFVPPDGDLPSQYFRRYLAGHRYGSLPRPHGFRTDWRDQVLFDPSTAADVRLTVRMVTAALAAGAPS